MTTRANWHYELLVDQAQPPVDVEEAGEPVFILDDEATLNSRLVVAMERATAIEAAGTTCSLMFSPGVVCSACPVRRTAPTDPMSALCAAGMEVERIETTLVIQRERTSSG